MRQQVEVRESHISSDLKSNKSCLRGPSNPTTRDVYCSAQSRKMLCFALFCAILRKTEQSKIISNRAKQSKTEQNPRIARKTAQNFCSVLHRTEQNSAKFLFCFSQNRAKQRKISVLHKTEQNSAKFRSLLTKLNWSEALLRSIFTKLSWSEAFLANILIYAFLSDCR